ncbi:hypothetical protein [Zavarzinella formosa]|uniref:hypothetical protein n=1 Tax=Zavarzinella formosa TaxID=360055 RepID=UPI000301C0D6|nr:hypothetical protein [Zavarzinella formosa]
MTQYIGRETTIEVGGQSYTLSRYDREILDQMTEWARAQLPNPLEAIKGHIADFPKHLQELMLREAVANASRKLSFDSPQIQEILNSVNGAMRVISLLLKKHHPDINEEKVWAIIEQLAEERGSQAEAERYLSDKLVECQGRFPKST